MIELALFLALGLVILVLYELRERKRARRKDAADLPSPPEEEKREEVSECCGAHLVCERETLLQTNAEVVYYDDEELDALSGREADSYSDAEADAIREVFHTLREDDVTGWVRSMQLRDIQLPADVREEALLIVRERRKK